MSNLNSVLLEGVLQEDALFRETPKGKLACTFAIASVRHYRDSGSLESEVAYFSVEARGDLAERIKGLAVKGAGCRVVGRLSQERWVGVDGKERSKVSIVAEHVEFRPDVRQDRAKKGASPCDECPMEDDCCNDNTDVRYMCGAYKAYLDAKAAKKRSSTKKKG